MFTIEADESRSGSSRQVCTLLRALLPDEHHVGYLKLELLNLSYIYGPKTERRGLVVNGAAGRADACQKAHNRNTPTVCVGQETMGSVALY